MIQVLLPLFLKMLSQTASNIVQLTFDLMKSYESQNQIANLWLIGHFTEHYLEVG